MGQPILEGFSIILCTYNGQSRLEATFNHIAALQIPCSYKVELILINNASTDDTESFSKKLWNELGQKFPLTVLNESRPGKAYAIEMGYDAAKYSHIITVDDDNWLFDNYLLQASEIITKYPKIGLIGSFSIGVFESQKPLWLDQIPVAYAVGQQASTTGFIESSGQVYFWGAGLIVNTMYWRIIRKQGFEFIVGKAKGKAVGEDSELCIMFQQLGYRFYYSKNLRLEHWMPKARLTEDNCLNMFRGFGKTDVYFELYRILDYKVRMKRKVRPFLIYSAMFKSKFSQLVKKDKVVHAEPATKDLFLRRLQYERKKARFLELIKLTLCFSKILKIIQHNLSIYPSVQDE